MPTDRGDQSLYARNAERSMKLDAPFIRLPYRFDADTVMA
jgi:hypothetical protein